VPELKAVQAVDLELRHGPQIGLASSTFTIPSGLITAVIGPNGSGKSTLLNGLAGLLQPSGGSIEVLGDSPERVRKRIAYVLQSTKVNENLPVTVREVVAMGRYAGLGSLRRASTEDRRAVQEAIVRLGIEDVARRHLHELSGGQRQRVFVAQGLVQEHELLLMDEPTTGLDLVSTTAISHVIRQEREDRGTVVFTTHELADAYAADHVILLAGRVVAAGAPSEVLTTESLSDAYRTRVIEVGGRILVDDSAHQPVGEHHVHLERGAATHEHD
jgi:iron complex transport system ATP-binding protein